MVSPFKKIAMHLIVGLGNPGSKYADNRHNIGFHIVMRFAEDIGAPAFKAKFKGVFTKAYLGSKEVVLLMPGTYMNLSGESVAPALKFFGIPPERLIVVHDELDLPFGEVRIKKGGGLAGHNGLRSIARHLGTQDFLRLRFGIDRPVGRPVAAYVLSDFSKDERAVMDERLEFSCAALRAIIEDGVEAAMLRFHTKR